MRVSAIRKNKAGHDKVGRDKAGHDHTRLDKTAPADAAVAAALAAVSLELKTLADRNERLQAVISQLVDCAGDDLPPSAYELQDLDRTTQVLQNLALFVGALARQADAQWLFDADAALSPVTLRDLAMRLGGEGERHDSGASGECALF